MYELLLNMTWQDFMNSEYLFKSNTEKHVIEIKGNEFDENDESLFVLYFNVFTGEVMVAIQMTNSEVNIPDCIKDKYIVTKTERGGDDDEFSEVVFVLKTLSEALTD